MRDQEQYLVTVILQVWSIPLVLLRLVELLDRSLDSGETTKVMTLLQLAWHQELPLVLQLLRLGRVSQSVPALRCSGPLQALRVLAIVLSPLISSLLSWSV